MRGKHIFILKGIIKALQNFINAHLKKFTCLFWFMRLCLDLTLCCGFQSYEIARRICCSHSSCPPFSTCSLPSASRSCSDRVRVNCKAEHHGLWEKLQYNKVRLNKYTWVVNWLESGLINLTDQLFSIIVLVPFLEKDPKFRSFSVKGSKFLKVCHVFFHSQKNKIISLVLLFCLLFIFCVF